MSKHDKATEDALNKLHAELADTFTDLLTNGEVVKIDGEAVRVKPGAAVLNAARQFLKDNGIETTLGQSKPTQDLASTLPFAGGEADEDDEAPVKH